MVLTTYDLWKECFDELKTCKPEERKPILLGYAAHGESRELKQHNLGRRRGIDECIKIAKRHGASKELMDELAGLYGYAKADRT